MIMRIIIIAALIICAAKWAYTMVSEQVKKKIISVFDEVFYHDGYGNFSVSVRILKRGQKEVIIDCGKQYRYVLDEQSIKPKV
jgi:hypothetical protein